MVEILPIRRKTPSNQSEIVYLCFVSINNVWNFSLIRIRKLFEQLLNCSYSYPFLVIYLNIQHNLEKYFLLANYTAEWNSIAIAICQLEQYHKTYISFSYFPDFWHFIVTGWPGFALWRTVASQFSPPPPLNCLIRHPII